MTSLNFTKVTIKKFENPTKHFFKNGEETYNKYLETIRNGICYNLILLSL